MLCPHCNQFLEDAADLAGQDVACPHCGQQFQMPGGVSVLERRGVRGPSKRTRTAPNPLLITGIAAGVLIVVVAIVLLANGSGGSGAVRRYLRDSYGSNPVKVRDVISKRTQNNGVVEMEVAFEYYSGGAWRQEVALFYVRRGSVIATWPTSETVRPGNWTNGHPDAEIPKGYFDYLDELIRKSPVR